MSEEEKNKKSNNIAGWVALIGAFATILTAIGANQFFPDLVKSIFIKPTSQLPNSPIPAASPTSPIPTASPTSPIPTASPTSPIPTASPTSPIPTASPTSPIPTSPIPTLTPTPKLLDQKLVEDYVFKFYGCIGKGEDIECNLTITNQIKDRKFTLNSRNYFDTDLHTKIIDNEGKSHSISILELGGYKGEGYMTVNSIQGLDYRTILIFKKVQNEVNKIKRLSISITNSNSSGNPFLVAFDDIQVSK